MTKSKLGQLLDCFENASGGLSLPALARQLDLSRGQAENLVDFWVRRGRIRAVDQQPDCAACGDQNGCPYLVETPRYYEIVLD
jgi:hypothetical protein